MQVMQALPSQFAPAERADEEELKHQVSLLAASPMTQQLLTTEPHVILVLNRYRQIVGANAAAERLLGLESSARVLGLRPGEALNCLHAAREEGGCGTSELCGCCGVVNAIVASQRGRQETRVCRIATSDGESHLDLRVSSMPMQIENQRFTVFVAKDPAHESQRHALERATGSTSPPATNLV